MVKAGKQSKYALFDNWLHKAHKLWYLHAMLYSHLEEQRKLTCTEREARSIL